jgi:hypothetical protein
MCLGLFGINRVNHAFIWGQSITGIPFQSGSDHPRATRPSASGDSLPNVPGSSAADDPAQFLTGNADLCPLK